MKIFGIGLNKTGTTTLGHCFKELGFRHLSCRRDLLIEYKSGNLDRVLQVIDKHDTFEDWPYPLMYRDLLSRYGDEAKFVLTLRSSPERWLTSLKKHSLNTHPDKHCRTLAYGYDYPFGHEQQHIDFYLAHNAEVVRYFAEQGRSDQLLQLCWEEGDGWPELCGFLGVPVPAQALPVMNPAKEITRSNARQTENRKRAGFWGEI